MPANTVVVSHSVLDDVMKIIFKLLEKARVLSEEQMFGFQKSVLISSSLKTLLHMCLHVTNSSQILLAEHKRGILQMSKV